MSLISILARITWSLTKQKRFNPSLWFFGFSPWTNEALWVEAPVVAWGKHGEASSDGGGESRRWRYRRHGKKRALIPMSWKWGIAPEWQFWCGKPWSIRYDLEYSICRLSLFCCGKGIALVGKLSFFGDQILQNNKCIWFVFKYYKQGNTDLHNPAFLTWTCQNASRFWYFAILHFLHLTTKRWRSLFWSSHVVLPCHFEVLWP